MTALTPTQRSKARHARAAAIIPAITLDATQAAALAAIRQRTGETVAGIVRRLIVSCANDTTNGS
jgi:hypothetical protein